MELYIEDSEFRPGHPLHWDLPEGQDSPLQNGRPRRQRRMPPGRSGQLITIGRSSERDASYAHLIEHFCDTPQQIISVIQGFSNLTALYINSHGRMDQRTRDAETAGHRGIQLGGTTIYAENLGLFRTLHPNFDRWQITDPAYVELASTLETPEPLLGLRIPRERVNAITPRIVLCGCSIAQDRSFCQSLADAAETYVFGATIDQFSGRRASASPWTLDGPVFVFIPGNRFSIGTGISDASSIQNRSSFSRRLGHQNMATGGGRGTGRIQGPLGRA